MTPTPIKGDPRTEGGGVTITRHDLHLAALAITLGAVAGALIAWVRLPSEAHHA